MTESFDDIRAQLETSMGWSELNAYERTKRCCEELVKSGSRIPSWMVIRNIIGKGSANDINRGKEDFRREHGHAMRNTINNGVPEPLLPHVLTLWNEALAQAKRELEAQTNQWLAEIERLGVERNELVYKLDELNQKVVLLENENAALRAQLERAEARVDRLTLVASRIEIDDRNHGKDNS